MLIIKNRSRIKTLLFFTENYLSKQFSKTNLYKSLLSASSAFFRRIISIANISIPTMKNWLRFTKITRSRQRKLKNSYIWGKRMNTTKSSVRAIMLSVTKTIVSTNTKKCFGKREKISRPVMRLKYKNKKKK